MEKKEYIEKIKELLTENLNSESDISPNGMFVIYKISKQYQSKISQETIDIVTNKSKWLIDYFMHCRHMARPIDKILATNIINSLEFV